MVYRRASGKPRRLDRCSGLVAGILLLALALIARLFVLQVLQHGFYAALAKNREAGIAELTPTRGEIYFRDAAAPNDLLPLATNRDRRLLYASPKEMHGQDLDAIADQLAQLLTLDRDAVRERLNRPDDTFEPIAHEVPLDIADAVTSAKLVGIHALPEIARYYPFASIASQVTGFLGYDGDRRVGQYGVEGGLDEILGGEPGSLSSGGSIFANKRSFREPKEGDSVVLTIDRTLQYTACKKLDEAVQKHGADGGSVIIVNPSSGAILALCNSPSFDANDYRNVANIAQYTNSAVSGQYEPGSVMKTMTMAGGINEGLITPDTTYEDTGSVQIGKYAIRNAENKTYGRQTMSGVLQESINTGAIYVQRLLGHDTFRRYMEQFGFGALTGIELQGEAKGDISTLKQKSDIYPATASFGQGISVTPLQLVMAYAAVVNDGILMKPYIVDEVIKPNGFREKTQPAEVRRVIEPQAATTLKAMLVNVVREGHGKRAAVPGYYIGGKTGTAQVPYGDRPGYDPSRNIGTFVGFGPLNKPAFVMLTKINVPRDVQFAESSAAPLFGELASFLLQYYQVPHDAE